MLAHRLENRWRLERGKGLIVLLTLILGMLVQASAFFGHLVGSVHLLLLTGPQAVPAAILVSGCTLLSLGLIFSVIELVVPRFTGMAVTGLILALLYLVGALTIPYFPAGAGFLLFILGQVLVFGVCVRLRGALTQYLEGRQLATVLHLLVHFEVIGAIFGSVVAWLLVDRTHPVAVLLLIGAGCLSIALVAGWASLLGQAKLTTTPERLRVEARRYKHELRRFAPILIAIAILFFILPFAWGVLQGEVLSFFSFQTSAENIRIWRFLTYVYLGVAVARFPFYLAFEWFARRIGAVRSNLIYPLLIMAVLIWWMADFTSFGPPIALLFLYIVDAHLLVARQSAAVLPDHLLRPMRVVGFEWIAPIGMATAGLVLIALADYLPSRLAISVALCITVVALAAGLGMGWLFRKYWRLSIREHRWQSSGEIPKTDPEEVVSLLESDDSEAQRVGLFLASQSGEPARYLPQLPGLLRRCSREVLVSTGLAMLGKLDTKAFAQLLESEDRHVRARTLAGAAVHKIPVGLAPLTALLRDPDPWVQLMACCTSWRLGLERLATVTWDALRLETIEDEALVEFIEVARMTQNEETIGVLKQLAHYTSWRVREAAMVALGEVLGGRAEGHADLLETGLKGSTHDNEHIRAASVNLILASESDNRAEHIARLLGDEAESVRKAASAGLAQLGEEGFAAARPYLSAEDNPTEQAALLAAAGMGRAGKEAQDTYLFPLLDWVQHSLDYPLCLQEEGGLWNPVSTALRSFRQRVCMLVADVAEVSGRHEVALAVRQLTGHLPPDKRVHLLEALRRKASRRVSKVLINLLKNEGLDLPLREARDVELNSCHPRVLSAIKDLLKAPDPYLPVAAALVWEEIHDELPPMPEEAKARPLMVKTLEYLAQPKGQRRPKEYFMNRLLFLKNIPYFEGLLLEELLRIDQRMTQEEFLEGEIIFKEGEPGTRFYIVYEGKVTLLHGGRTLAEVEAGGHFAEMALFEDQPRSATARAATKCLLLSLDKASFNSLVIQRPAILLQICRELSRRLRVMDKRFSETNPAPSPQM